LWDQLDLCFFKSVHLLRGGVVPLSNDLTLEVRVHVSLDHVLQVNRVEHEGNLDLIIGAVVDLGDLAGWYLHGTVTALKFVEDR